MAVTAGSAGVKVAACMTAYGNGRRSSTAGTPVRSHPAGKAHPSLPHDLDRLRGVPLAALVQQPRLQQ
jgi:hypothetical protein